MEIPVRKSVVHGLAISQGDDPGIFLQLWGEDPVADASVGLDFPVCCFAQGALTPLTWM